MKNLIKLIVLASILIAFTTSNKTTYKCMLQMTNYSGEGAYISVSLLDSKGAYIKTLSVIGEDEKWYSDVLEWWQFQEGINESIDAITGATLSGGERSIVSFEIDDDKIDKDYKIRFESAVENQEYYKDDVEFELTSQSVSSKVEGHGFIRYIRLMPK